MSTQEKLDLQAEDRRTDLKAETVKRFNAINMGVRNVEPGDILYEPGAISEDLADDVAALSPKRNADVAGPSSRK